MNIKTTMLEEPQASVLWFSTNDPGHKLEGDLEWMETEIQNDGKDDTQKCLLAH